MLYAGQKDLFRSRHNRACRHASADILPSGHARQTLMGESAWHDAARRGTTRHVSTGQCHNTASGSTARPTRDRDDDGVVRRPCGVVSRREAGRAAYSCMYTLVGWRWDAACATVGMRAAARPAGGEPPRSGLVSGPAAQQYSSEWAPTLRWMAGRLGGARRQLVISPRGSAVENPSSRVCRKGAVLITSLYSCLLQKKNRFCTSRRRACRHRLDPAFQ